MTALAATDFTVTIEERRIVGKKRRNRVKLVFGDGLLTYPSGGIPLPAYAALGLKRNVDYLNIIDQDDSLGTVWKYDKDNHKLRAFVQGVLVGAAGAVAMDDFPVTAAFGTDAAISVSLTGTAGAGTHLVGTLKEVTTADAPAAATMYVEAVGW